MALSSTLADKGSEVVGFPVPKLSTGSISGQFIGPDETAIMARCLLCTNFYPFALSVRNFHITVCSNKEHYSEFLSLIFSEWCFFKPRGKEHKRPF